MKLLAFILSLVLVFLVIMNGADAAHFPNQQKYIYLIVENHVNGHVKTSVIKSFLVQGHVVTIDVSDQKLQKIKSIFGTTTMEMDYNNPSVTKKYRIWSVTLDMTVHAGKNLTIKFV